MQRREGKYGLGWANLRYVLTTGKNWNGPIKDFQLTIRKQAPSDILSLCLDGELSKQRRVLLRLVGSVFLLLGRPRHG